MQHVGVVYYHEDLMEGLGWNLNILAEIMSKNGSVLDKVVIDMKVINYVTGHAVYEGKVTTYCDEVSDSFLAESSCTVLTLGTYYLYVTYKCYKNGTLIETVNNQSKLLSI